MLVNKKANIIKIFNQGLFPKTLIVILVIFFSFFGSLIRHQNQKMTNSAKTSDVLVVSGNSNFRVDEIPEFRVDLPKGTTAKTSLSKVFEIFGVRTTLAGDVVKSEVSNYYDPTIKPQTVAEFDGNGVKLTVPKPETQFRPGKYSIKIEFNAGDQVLKTERDFTWGVLAVNTDKSVYSPGETANLQLGALTDVGSTICRGNLELGVTDPQGKTTVLSTKDGSIAFGTECRGNNVTDKPDYVANYFVMAVGEYKLKFTNLDNGYSIEDRFVSQKAVPFIVERIGATRINPTRADYAMSFRITANEDFSGDVSETVPGGFVIKETGDAMVQAVGETNVLTWRSIALKAGEVKILRYVYDAPNISPKIYELGPLSFTENGIVRWQEARRWQIAADATKTAAGTGNWNTAATWSPSGVPAAGDDVIIISGYTVTMNVNNPASPATITLGGATAGTLSMSLANTSLTFTITGNVTINSNGSFVVTNATAANTHTVNIGGNLVENGTFDMGSATDDYATVVFNGTSAQTISGTGATCRFFSLTANNSSATGLTLARNVTVQPTSVLTTTITVSANRVFDIGAYTIDRSAAGAGSFIINSGSTLKIGGTGDFPTNYTTNTINAASTVNYNGTTQSVNAFTYGNLQINGSGTKTSAGVITVSVNLTIGDGATLSHGAYNLTVTGTSTIGGGTSGGLTLSSATGTKQFTGAVTVANGATWNNSGNSAVNFRGGLTNNGTFTAGSGVYTFDTNSQNLYGTVSIPNVTVTGVTLTNNNSLTVGTALSGTGGVTQASSASLTITGTSGITTLTATASSNTVTYNGSSQTVKATTYYTLTMNGSGTATLGGTVSATTLNVSASVLNTNNQSLSVSGTTTVDGGLGITTGTSGTISFGNLTISATGAFSNSVNDDFSISGNFSNSNTFSAGTGNTVTLNGVGGSTQTITGSSTFPNLTATASSARTIRFAASSTTTVTGTWTVAGSSGQRITLTSTTTSQWSVNPTTPAVSYVDLNYSNNISGSTACATYSQTTSGNNTSWMISDSGSCVSVPNPPVLYPDDGGTYQVTFNNTRQFDATPIVRASATHTASFNRFQIEFNAASDFGGTAYTETLSGTYLSGTPYNLQTTGTLGLPTTDGVTYYVRVRASADGGSSLQRLVCVGLVLYLQKLGKHRLVSDDRCTV